MANIITEKEYHEDSSALYEKYYAQFITPSIKSYVERKYTKEFIQKCYSKDIHLNNLGKNWLEEFDRFTECIKGEIAGINKRINGKSTWSYSIGTSTIKVYMKIYAGILKID